MRKEELNSKLTDPFLRIHKSYLVAIGHIDAFEQQQVRIGGATLPVSRSQKRAVLNLSNLYPGLRLFKNGKQGSG